MTYSSDDDYSPPSESSSSDYIALSFCFLEGNLLAFILNGRVNRLKKADDTYSCFAMRLLGITAD